MLSKKKSEPQGPLFFCSRVSPGSGHFVTVTDYPKLNITLVWIVTGTGTWV